MIESIITDYLRQHRRLVLPELGAFLKKEEGETVFVPFLNKDDGVLNGLVRQIYGASSAEAEGIISNYVKNIRAGIQSKGSYLVSPLGSLKQDANGVLFLDTTDLNPRPVVREVVVKEVIIPQLEEEIISDPEIETISEPEIFPEPEVQKYVSPVQPIETEEAQIMADTLDAPKTLNDLIRESQEQEQPAQTIHSRAVEAPKAVKQIKKPVKPADTPQKRVSTAPVKKGKRGDIVLIAAIVVAVIAVIAMIYAYAVVDLPLFNLK